MDREGKAVRGAVEGEVEKQGTVSDEAKYRRISEIKSNALSIRKLQNDGTAFLFFLNNGERQDMD